MTATVAGANVDGPVTGIETGLPDSWWITRVRRGLRDFGKVQADSQVGNGTDGVEAPGAMPFQSTKQPILDGSVVVQDNGANLALGAGSTGLGAGQYWIDMDTGELFLSAAPLNSHTITWKYRYVKWRDQDISDALQAGIRAINAVIGKVDQDETLRPVPTKTDYDLPGALQDPDARMVRLEFRTLDSPIFPYNPYDTWELTGWTNIKIIGAKYLSPAGRFRIIFVRPYQGLGDLEPARRELPIWYALSVLLPHQEGFRMREDRVSARISDQSNNPSVQLQTGEYYAKRFETELARLAKKMPKGLGRRRMVSTYEMERGSYGGLG